MGYKMGNPRIFRGSGGEKETNGGGDSSHSINILQHFSKTCNSQFIFFINFIIYIEIKVIISYCFSYQS